MSSQKKPLLTREEYKEFQKEQAKKEAGVSKQESEMPKTKSNAKKMPTQSTGKGPISRKAVHAEEKDVVQSKSINSQKTVKKHAKNAADRTKDVRLDSKEKGRQLDSFLNKAIIFFIILIVLVFVIAFLL